MAEEVIQELRQQIADRGLSHSDAAGEIGVTEDSLRRHLRGEYARSDSIAKYRLWLSGSDSSKGRQLSLIESAEDADEAHSSEASVLLPKPTAPEVPHRIVDLFSGCGGLSLGFELALDRQFFSTVLAIDIEQAMVDTFNANHWNSDNDIAVPVDLSDFYNESEVRAFYLDHLLTVEGSAELAEDLDQIVPIGLPAFVAEIQELDASFLGHYRDYRYSEPFEEAYSEVDSRTLSQTSVEGFHESLRLPHPSSRDNALGPLIWGDRGHRAERLNRLPEAVTTSWRAVETEVRKELEARWDTEYDLLIKKSSGSGRGQLASSARKISAFLRFMESVPDLRKLWLDWRAKRDSLRFLYFGSEEAERGLSEAYEAHGHVSVILGGPPCQGFSRIGRGKIRSLRDDAVHAHYDAESGDLRNRLFEKYVLFVSALAPEAFLFENVAHFKTRVKTPEGSFLATEVLREAVRDLSHGGLDYVLESGTLVASEHGVPQNRERFFMTGVRQDVSNSLEAALGSDKAASWILGLPSQDPVPLKVALDDLPSPFWVNGRGAGSELERRVERRVEVDASAGSAEARYRAWIRQEHPTEDGSVATVDSHVARDHRRDDREFFALMGPGRRWMDYRCDGTPTLRMLERALECLSRLAEEGHLGDDDLLGEEDVKTLLGKTDGSLSLRLLLETIEPQPGELGHHLLKSTYLRKRDGNHGDWLSRLDGELPSKTVVTHMGKDTYAYVHPWEDRSLSIREAARIQSFPDWFSFSNLGLVDAFRVIGNAVPPLLSAQLALRMAHVLGYPIASSESEERIAAGIGHEAIHSGRAGD